LTMFAMPAFLLHEHLYRCSDKYTQSLLFSLLACWLACLLALLLAQSNTTSCTVILAYTQVSDPASASVALGRPPSHTLLGGDLLLVGQSSCHGESFPFHLRAQTAAGCASSHILVIVGFSCRVSPRGCLLCRVENRGFFLGSPVFCVPTSHWCQGGPIS
jgi:hypothetical protein